ncbi:MAG: HNH endonuclease [Bdellovibrionaceae bacterium]|nr:HNH endonuclease [Pseudobdellovibrionaceae bacterium]
MEAVNLLDEYSVEIECVFEGERYSVRDNGAILRHERPGGRSRPNDNKWTFGKPNRQNAYLMFSGVRVHRIVATAFHGDPPDPKYVVDHIDTNCRNNRPENLRWLTRLENSLQNPVTRKKIEYLCGSIDAFLENPSMLNGLATGSNYAWMRSVTPEEAHNCKVRMSAWAKLKKKPSKPGAKPIQSFGSRVYKPLQKWEVGLAGEPGLELTCTPGCASFFWRGRDKFPCSPEETGINPISDYFQKLKPGLEFSYSDLDDWSPRLLICDYELINEGTLILVMCERDDGKWTVAGIEFHGRSQHFVHFHLGDYGERGEAESAFEGKRRLKDFWSEAYKSQNKVISKPTVSSIESIECSAGQS